ncbi:MAG TPA: hypothetical protein DCR63_05060, partial [Microbacterium sp.]|nr:hypothetical protein [Microbacterium sp.]
MLAGLLTVVALVVWLLVAQPWRGSADSTAHPAPSSSSPSAGPSASTPTLPDPSATGGSNPVDALPEEVAATDAATTLTPEGCRVESVLVEAVTDKET